MKREILNILIAIIIGAPIVAILGRYLGNWIFETFFNNPSVCQKCGKEMDLLPVGYPCLGERQKYKEYCVHCKRENYETK